MWWKKKLRERRSKERLELQKRNEEFLRSHHAEGFTSVPQLWRGAAASFPTRVAYVDGDTRERVSYGKMASLIEEITAGLRSCGFQRGERVPILAKRSYLEKVTEQALMTLGAVSVPRSGNLGDAELISMFKDIMPEAVILEDIKAFERLSETLSEELIPKRLLFLNAKTKLDVVRATLQQARWAGWRRTSIHSLDELRLAGRSADAAQAETPIDEGALATIAYTAGTEGDPKPVAISHGNILHQIRSLGSAIAGPMPGDTVLVLHPSGRIQERVLEFFLHSRGCRLVFCTLETLARELHTFLPHYVIADRTALRFLADEVLRTIDRSPRLRAKSFFTLFRSVEQSLLEYDNRGRFQGVTAAHRARLVQRGLRRSLKAALGGRLREIIYLDEGVSSRLHSLFTIAGIPIISNYSLSETTSFVTVRRRGNSVGSSGHALAATRVCIAHPETDLPVAAGERGEVLVHGPQVASGYLRNSKIVYLSLNSEGWLRTGDMGTLLPDNQLIIFGRKADILRLPNQMAVDPHRLEEACLGVPAIEDVLVSLHSSGTLTALVRPNYNRLAKLCLHLRIFNRRDFLEILETKPQEQEKAFWNKLGTENPTLQEEILKEMNSIIRLRGPSRDCETICSVKFLKEAEIPLVEVSNSEGRLCRRKVASRLKSGI